MNFDWLKRYVPRSLYARAALILLVPILTIQIVVTVVFIQRLYNDVTEQMTRNLLYELEYFLDAIGSAPDIETARRRATELSVPFEIYAVLPAQPPAGDSRIWYDISGREVTATLRNELQGVLAVDLGRTISRVAVSVSTPHGPMELDFSRRRVSASNPHQLLVLMALTSILMTIIAFVYLRNQLRPVKRLAQAAEGFGRGRIVPFRPSGATEMRAAGSAFLDMRNRIERMIEQRTLMLSGVSHDLRTPLTRLRLGLSLQDETPETAAMQRDVNDMERLLQTFIDFARGEAIDDRAEIDPVPLMRDLRDRWSAAGHDVELEEAGELPTITASPVALYRALENLLGNAVRYGKHARLGVSAGERSVRFTVEDDGPGIPADMRGEALKPFSRLDLARNQDRGPGVGLGLAIAYDVARRHGGSLRLGESKELGGLRADIVLPK
jgi:two-component system osmolarity sensor histidine kinase EnvZ